MMNKVLAIVLCLMLAASTANAQRGGVVGPPPQANKVEVVGQTAYHGSNLLNQLVSVPADDSGKWQVLVFCGPNCPPCERLKADLKSNQDLKTLASEDGSGWAHLNVYEVAPAQQWRYADFQIKSYPTIVVTPPTTSTQFEYIAVYRKEGYSGDAAGLAEDITHAITRYAEQCCPKPTPDNPAPVKPVLPSGLPNFPPKGIDTAIDSVYVFSWMKAIDLKTIVLFVGAIFGTIWVLRNVQLKDK